MVRGRIKQWKRKEGCKLEGKKKKQVSSIAFPTLFPSFVLILLIELMFQVKK